MSNSLLRRLLGRAGAAAEGAADGATFSLPGSLGPGARVLLLASDDLTDLLFAMPLVDGIREAVPDASIGLVCDERTSQLALSTDRFADVLVVDPAALEAAGPVARSIGSELRQDDWDVAIVLGRDPDPVRDTLAHLSGATLRMGPDHPKAFPNLNCQVRPPATRGYPYERSILWGRLLGLSLEGAPLEWPLDGKRERQMAQLVHFNKPRKQQRLIGVDPGVAKGGTRLGVANLKLIADHVARTIDSRSIVLTADPDPSIVTELQSALVGTPLDLPRPTLLEMVLLVSQCDLLLSGNTDLMHFAAARGVPVLGLFPEAEDDAWVPTRAERFEKIAIAAGESLDLADLMDRVERLLS